QLPRVQDRLMGLMWLLAEFWGRVTPAGIRLPVSLSHEVLGGLVGARRPTVTLALSELAEGGSLIRHEDGWLILEPPATPLSSEPHAPQLMVTAPENSVWAAVDPPEPAPQEMRDLIQHVAQAREHAARDRRHARELAAQARALHEQARRFTTDPGHES